MSRGMLTVLVAIVAIAGLAVLSLGGSYNRLVGLDEQVNEAWSQVENAYQRRADLVPNLVETVKGAASFERDTLTAVTEARAKVGQVRFDGPPTAEQMQAFQANQDGLSSALSRLLVVSEQYPELRATEAFRDLQAQLEGTENRIAVERRRYNETAREYNTARRGFPTVMVAGMLGFDERAYFEAVEGAETAPQVDFGSGSDDG